MPRRSLEGPKKAPDLVPRNSRGGVLVTDDELKSAFEFFDVEGSGKITQVRSQRPVVWRCPHAIDATRLHQTSSSEKALGGFLLILRLFRGTRRHRVSRRRNSRND